MSILRDLRQIFHRRIVQLAALVVTFTVLLALSLITKGYLLDPDVWWHLKVGDWILQHRAVPLVGVLSRTAAARPWVAYSWGFEVILSRVYAWMGLEGFASFGIVLAMLVPVTLFGCCFALSRRFWVSCTLTLFGSVAFVYSLYPRPVFFSMALFTLMLFMILKAQRSGRIQILYWFPLLFLIWANLHIQFIYGLATIGLYIVVEVVLWIASRARVNLEAFRTPSLSPLALGAILLVSVATSCIGPYSYRLYLVVIEYSRAKQTYVVIQELLAPNFTSWTYFVFLLTVMAAFYAVGFRRKIDLFQLSLLIVASVCAFRTVRDAWFVAIPAILFIADSPAGEAEQDPGFSPAELLSLSGSTALLAFLLATNLGFTSRGMDASISSEFPVDAANFIRNLSPPGPIYNNFDWGGFLTWYLPNYPVEIDGRNDLYGDSYVAHHIQFNEGDRTDGDQQLDEAGVVLLSREASLAKILKVDARFRLVYEDRMADVFLRN